jgi:hypothetical protein
MRASRARLFAEAGRDRATLAFTHAPFPGWGRVIPTGAGYRWEWLAEEGT